jgi:hypothetical protein
MSQTETTTKTESQFHEGFAGVNHTLELDSAPGSYPRGPELMEQVLDGTGLVNGVDVVCTGTCFGNYTFEVDPAKDELYAAIKPKIEERIKSLYNSGRIRYGSW